MADRLLALASYLESQGLQAGEIAGLQGELNAIERPPGFFSRVTQTAKETARRQWAHVIGEIQESREVMHILTHRLAASEPLTEAERDKVQAQVLDVLRVVPAGLIVATNYCLPVPGTSFLTPWLLARLGLMPSRWREAHILTQLGTQSARLRQAGHAAEADRIDELHQAIKDEADQREAALHDAELLTHWDANDNGVWDDEERAAYQVAVDELREVAVRASAQKRWFLKSDRCVVGPIRLISLAERPTVPLLICYDGKSGWVDLDDLLDDELYDDISEEAVRQGINPD